MPDTTQNTVQYAEQPESPASHLQHQEPSMVGSVLGWIFLLCLLFIPFWMMCNRIRGWYAITLLTGKKTYTYVASLLEMNFPYYRKLATEKEKDRFVRRVICFRRLKQFKFQDMEKNRDVCYLVSASAIQLTFGLKNFRLLHFETIHIINGEYRHFAYATPFEGHVSNGQIYLSWPHFKYGYEQKNDSYNVGLHEMAHALAWQNFYTEDHHDPHFSGYFFTYSYVGRPLFQRMQKGEKNMLGPYAAANYDEFWATSVEVFFEQPEQMNKELPELYAAMCRLLKQDPAATA